MTSTTGVVPGGASHPRDAYTHGHHDSVLRSHRWRTAENSAAYLLPHLHPGLSVLDVGCGPGTITVDLAQTVAPGVVTGIDTSAKVLEQARQHAATAGVENVDFVEADVYALPFDADSFDIVHAHQVLQHLSDPVLALREIKRITKPGGLVAVRDADYAAMAWFPESEALTEWNTLYHEVAHANGAEPDAGRRLLSWVRAAGFADEGVTASAGVWCYANDADR
ncbi:MAG: class I SAM-dependent methyltransferase, partial [Cellulomonadaceae bacterium]